MLSFDLIREFKIPVFIFAGILGFLILKFLGMETAATLLAVFITGLGSYPLIKDSISAILRKEFVLDYIAILAIGVSLLTGEFLVASVIALMLSSGRTLEDYGVKNAKKNLTSLVDRIPNEVMLWLKNYPSEKVKISSVSVGQEIFIRKGEVIALDGVLISETGLTDESSLTGEPYEIEKISGDAIRSGTINIGEPIVVKVTRAESDSAYHKIVDMVKKAQTEKAPLIRLADRYSVFFTIVTLGISAFAFFYGGSMAHVLAVLVVATPCPLILATPIALIGGVNAASKKRIIIKKLAALEVLSRVDTLIFDKTGTITLGIPKVVGLEILDKSLTEKQILGISESLERNSLHPLAKAIVSFARSKNAPVIHSENIEEKIGSGIFGKVLGKTYSLSKIKGVGMSIGLFMGGKELAVFRFEDQIKLESKNTISNLKKSGYDLHIFTGDKKHAAEAVVKEIGENVSVKAECTPKDKQEGIEFYKNAGKTVGMVGDGINDAPALALADVGMVFSNEEQTASSEAADVIFLGGDFEHIESVLNISKKTIKIAIQSISWGIGISVAAMVFASLGYIPPVAGATLQEAIDVAVIINALRSSRV